MTPLDLLLVVAFDSSFAASGVLFLSETEVTASTEVAAAVVFGDDLEGGSSSVMFMSSHESSTTGIGSGRV